jgi:hypothetical protein
MGILPMSITGVSPVQKQKNVARMAMLLTGDRARATSRRKT